MKRKKSQKAEKAERKGHKGRFPRALAVLLIVFAAFAAVLAFLWNWQSASTNPATTDIATGYVHAVGTGIYDGDGNLLQLRGVNLGDWFVEEGYMSVDSVGGFEGGNYTQERARRAMEANPNLTQGQIQDLYDQYMSTFIREEDFQHIADMGMNAVRINFTYRNLTDDDGNFYPDGWKYLDWAVDMCEKYHLYAILDLHGAYGSQNQDHHSGDDTQFNLYGNPDNEEKTIRLWQEIASRYKDRTCVAGYDLLNECRKGYDQYGGKVNTDFYHVLYEAVREVDPHHMIIIEYFTFPIHGARLSHYRWHNICVEYHIYNLTRFTQLQTLRFYNFLNNFMGVDVPVYIGEWSCWDQAQNWVKSMQYFDKAGWSYTSWTYKTNGAPYAHNTVTWQNGSRMLYWGVYELDVPQIDVSTATYEELTAAYARIGTDHAQQTPLYEMYRTYLGQDMTGK